MQPANTKPLNKAWARAILWSIRRQDRIAHHFRLAVCLGVTIVAFMGVVGVLSLEGALGTLFYGGLLLAGGVLFLIVKRRAWLIGIKDPELREQAYQAMLAYLSTRESLPRQSRPDIKEADKAEECTTCRL